jgi:hypothetical protein
MKRLITTLFVYIILPNVFAQDMFEYYAKVNEGKAFAIEENYQSAVNSYLQAFENSEFQFARDCYNAIELSVLAEDTILLEYFMKKAAARGITISELEHSGKIGNYLHTPFFEKVKETEDSLACLYASRINWVLRAEVNQMFAEDQEMREQFYNSTFSKRKIRKKWEDLNAKQVDRLIQITRVHGFPGERLIGIDSHEMHPKINTQNYSAGMAVIILIHHYSKPNESFGKLLLAEVDKGNLYNEHFATICDFEAEFGGNQYEHFGYYGLRHEPRKPNEAMLNSRRQQIGILKIEQTDALNKVKNLTKFWNRLY